MSGPSHNRVVYFGLLLAVLQCVLATAIADVPKLINHQAYLTNSTGAPVTASVTIVFTIYDAPSNGNALWSETQTVAVNQGVFDVNLGSVNPIVLAFDVPYYLGIKVGSDAEMTPRQALTSVSYAFRSSLANAVADGSIGTSSLANGSVTTAKLGVVCPDKYYLQYSAQNGWTCSAGTPGPQGVQGATGATGPQGPAGPAGSNPPNCAGSSTQLQFNGTSWQCIYSTRDIMTYITTNPNGVWAYMQNSTGVHNPNNYTLFPNQYSSSSSCTFNEPMFAWMAQDCNSGYIGMPITTYSWSSAGLSQIAMQGVIHAHPGIYGNEPILRWTSPISGTVSISGRVTSVDGACGDGILWSLEQENKVLQSGAVKANSATFSAQSLPVTKGANFYFIIDMGANRDCDTTNLDMLITTQQ